LAVRIQGKGSQRFVAKETGSQRSTAKGTCLQAFTDEGMGSQWFTFKGAGSQWFTSQRAWVHSGSPPKGTASERFPVNRHGFTVVHGQKGLLHRDFQSTSMGSQWFTAKETVSQRFPVNGQGFTAVRRVISKMFASKVHIRPQLGGHVTHVHHSLDVTKMSSRAHTPLPMAAAIPAPTSFSLP